MASRFTAATNEDKVINKALPEIPEEGDEVRFGSFNRSSFVCLI